MAEIRIGGNRVLIGVPVHKGDVSGETMTSVVMAHSLVGNIVQVQVIGISLLARCFNSLWIAAYNAGFDYFVMLHSDIGVRADGGSSWLDVLVERIQQFEAATLSVVSPIKSDEGMTSTGLYLAKPPNYHTLRRMTIRELATMNEFAITRTDVCKKFGLEPKDVGALLINTGCMIIDLRRFDWFGARWPGFQIVDELVWNKSGVPSTRTRPEDWNFSSWLFEKGWPYYATKELTLDHHGSRIFQNRGLYGLETDTLPIDSSIEEYEASE